MTLISTFMDLKINFETSGSFVIIIDLFENFENIREKRFFYSFKLIKLHLICNDVLFSLNLIGEQILL